MADVADQVGYTDEDIADAYRNGWQAGYTKGFDDGLVEAGYPDELR